MLPATVIGTYCFYNLHFLCSPTAEQVHLIIFLKRFHFPTQTYLITIFRGGLQAHNKIELQFSREEISETFRKSLWCVGGHHIASGMYPMDGNLRRKQDEFSCKSWDWRQGVCTQQINNFTQQTKVYIYIVNTHRHAHTAWKPRHHAWPSVCTEHVGSMLPLFMLFCLFVSVQFYLERTSSRASWGQVSVYSFMETGVCSPNGRHLWNGGQRQLSVSFRQNPHSGMGVLVDYI